MSHNAKNHLPLLESIPYSGPDSIRLLTWDESLANPRLHSSNSQNEDVCGVGDRWHYHPYAELACFTSGGGIRFTGDSIEQFQSPDCILIGPLLPHCWRCEASSGVAVQWAITGDGPLARLPEFGLLNRLWNRASGGIKLQDELLEEVICLMTSLVHSNALVRLGTFFRILDTIESALPSQWQVLSQPMHAPHQDGGYAADMAAAIDFITQNFQEQITLSDVLEHVTMSRASFSRHFVRYTGQTYTIFLQRVRLEHSRRLLATGNYSIGEAAIASGFQNLSHFNRLFRKRWNMAPRDFVHFLKQSS